jgi:hypothetical protein
VSISGDTLLVKGAADTVHVLVSDVDGDALRDGIDPCPRDPLNKVAERCRRASQAYPVLDHLLTQTAFSISSPQTNVRVITATYENTSDTPIRNPFFEVTEINGQNLLLNADEGPAGVGATLSPDVGDGVLSQRNVLAPPGPFPTFPGETIQVEFVIRYRSRRVPLAFSVVFRGDPLPPITSD